MWGGWCTLLCGGGDRNQMATKQTVTKTKQTKKPAGRKTGTQKPAAGRASAKGPVEKSVEVESPKAEEVVVEQSVQSKEEESTTGAKPKKAQGSFTAAAKRRLIRALIEKARVKVEADESKTSMGDLIRLLQMEQELTPPRPKPRPKRIAVYFVKPGDDSK